MISLSERVCGLIKKGDKMKVVQIPLSMIRTNPQQPRKIFTAEELEELTGSIREYGVLQPLLVKKGENRTFTLIAGERRFRAAGRAGLERVPVIIKDLEEKEAALIALVENVQREDLNFLEEAKAYQKLMEDFDLTQGEIAKKVNKQQSTISNKIRILTLPEDVQEMILANKLTERHARALLKLSDGSDRKRVLERVVHNHLNVKQTEKLIDDILASRAKADKNRSRINHISYKIYLNTLKKAFDQVKCLEKNAKFTQNDMGEFLEVKIIIPKGDRCFT